MIILIPVGCITLSYILVTGFLCLTADAVDAAIWIVEKIQGTQTS